MEDRMAFRVGSRSLRIPPILHSTEGFDEGWSVRTLLRTFRPTRRPHAGSFCWNKCAGAASVRCHGVGAWSLWHKRSDAIFLSRLGNAREGVWRSEAVKANSACQSVQYTLNPFSFRTTGRKMFFFVQARIPLTWIICFLEIKSKKSQCRSRYERCCHLERTTLRFPSAHFAKYRQN